MFALASVTPAATQQCAVFIKWHGKSMFGYKIHSFPPPGLKFVPGMASCWVDHECFFRWLLLPSIDVLHMVGQTPHSFLGLLLTAFLNYSLSIR